MQQGSKVLHQEGCLFREELFTALAAVHRHTAVDEPLSHVHISFQ